MMGEIAKATAVLFMIGMMVNTTSAHCAMSKNDNSIEQKVNQLLSKMTLEEKIGQVTQYGGGLSPDGEKDLRNGQIGSVLSIQGSAEDIRNRVNELQHIAVEQSRLHIPLIVGFDVIHGFRTTFPIPLGMGATFDPDSCQLAARVAGREARAAGISWTFAPMIDVARDARWGRIAEGCGEDPYLTSMLGAAMVKGFQGDNLASQDAVAACAKHYLAYGAAEGGRDYDTADISVSTIYNVYLPPYRAAVDAGVQTVMPSFNEIGGIPMSCNKEMLTNVLKKQLGFDGFLISDAGAVGELLNHGVAGTRADAAMLAINAGMDMDMGSNCFKDSLVDLINSGKVKESTLDESVRRILRVKFRLGLFDHPYTDVSLLDKVELCPEHIAAAKKVAEKSIVLLKNDGNLLPLSKNVHSIAVIGSLADDRGAQFGTWAALTCPEKAVSVLDGIKNAVSPDTVVRYEPGCSLPGRYFETQRWENSMKTDGFAAAIDAAKKSDVVVLVVGENPSMSGEASSRNDISLPCVQEQLVEAIYAAGKPVVVVLMNGRPMAIPWIAEKIPAILEIWHPGIQAGPAAADVLFGDYNPGGKLPVTFPKSTGQCPSYYNHKNSGRPFGSHIVFSVGYCDSAYQPTFPFGYGLSYTTFEYSNLKVDPAVAKLNGSIHVSADVKNTGSRDGDEVVQLYIRDMVSSITRPVKELKGFRRISLKPGESKTVSFTLTSKDIEYYDNNGKPLIEPGLFKVWVGGSSVSGLEGEFNLTDNNNSKAPTQTKDEDKNTKYFGGVVK